MTITITTQPTETTVADLSSTSDSSHPSITWLPDGGFVVTWDTSSLDIDMQRFDSTGAKVGGVVDILTQQVSDASTASVTTLANGDLAVTWFHGGIAANNEIISPSGSVISAPTTNTTGSNSTKTTQHVTALSGGGFVMVCDDLPGDGSGYGVSVQVYDSTGAKVGGEIAVNTFTTGDQKDPSITGLVDGDFLVTWQSVGQNGNGISIYAQRYDGSGAAVGSQVLVNTATMSDQVTPSVAALTDGGYVIAWQGYQVQSMIAYPHIYYLRYDASGVAVGSETPIAASAGLADTQPAVSELSNGGFTISWVQGGLIESQRFDSSGQVIGGVETLNTDGVTTVLYPRVSNDLQTTALTGGGYGAVWVSQDTNGDGVHVSAAPLPVTSSVLTTAVERAFGDGSNDTFMAAAGVLSAGDAIDGGGGVNTLQMTSAGSLNFTGVSVQNVQQFIGSAGDDTITFAGAPATSMAMNSGGGHDTLTVGSFADLSELTGNWTVEGAAGANVTFKLTDPSQIAMVHSGGATTTIDASTLALTSAQESQLFSQGADKILQPMGLAVTSTGKTLTAGYRTGSFGNASLGALANGDFVLASALQGAHGSQVEVQTYSSSGAALGAPTLLDTNATYYAPSVAALSTGGYVVTWAGSTAQPNSANIPEAQIFDAHGNEVGTPIQLYPGAPFGGDYTGISVIGLTDGSFVVGWDNDRTNINAVLQHVSGSGTLLGPQISLSGLSALPLVPDMVALANGDFAVVLAKQGIGLVETIYNSQGVQVGDVSLDSSNGIASLSPLADGGFAAVWTSYDSSGRTLDGAHLQLFDGSGTATTQSQAIDLVQGAYAYSVTDSGDGNVVVSASNSAQNTVSQAFDANGLAVGPSYTLAGYGEDAVMLQNGGYVQSNFSTTGNQLHILSQVDAVLTSGADTITGSAGGILVATAPGDLGAGDSLVGGGGVNSLQMLSAGTLDLTAPAAFSGFQSIGGSEGNDTFIVNTARLADVITIDGHDGLNTVSYAPNPAGISADLTSSLFANIENLTGTAFNDVLSGNGGSNVLQGLDGNDVLSDGVGSFTGDDTLDGGSGIDTASYAFETASVTVSLAITGVQDVQDQKSDTLISIENLTGSAFNDTLTGNSGANVITGGGGNDTIDGGAGSDTAVYSGAESNYQFHTLGGGVIQIVDMRTGSPDGTDTIKNIEQVKFSDGTFAASSLPISHAAPVVGGNFVTYTYDEHNAAIPVGAGITVSDSNSTTLASATVTISAGFVAGDTLSFTAQTGITGSYDANSHTLTLTGSASIAAYQAAMDSVTFVSTSDNPNNFGANPSRTISWAVDDGASANHASNVTTATIEVNNIVLSTSGNDTLTGGPGNDTFLGGVGTDTVSYSNATAAVTVGLFPGAQNTVGAGIDTLSSIENLTGSAFDDHLTGGTGANVINGGDGNDVIIGLGGHDTLIGGNGNDSINVGPDVMGSVDGGAGTDSAFFEAASASVIVNLATGVATSANGGSLTITNVENVGGSNFNDVLTGDAGNNQFFASAGDDSYIGGGGRDAVFFSLITSGVTVDLSLTGPQVTGGAGTDTLTGISDLVGSNFADTLTGNAGDNLFYGGAGNDTIDGGAGNNTIELSGAQGDYTFQNLGNGVIQVTDTRTGSPDGTDHIKNIQQIAFSNGAVTQQLSDILANAPPVVSGASSAINYGEHDAAVVVGAGLAVSDPHSATLASATVTISAGFVTGDVLGFANQNGIVGSYDASSHILTLTGAASLADYQAALDSVTFSSTSNNPSNFDADTLRTISWSVDDGGSVNHASNILTTTIQVSDTVTGTAGNDVLTAGPGNDTLNGLAGDDTLIAGAGADHLIGGLGNDTYVVTNASQVVTELAGQGTDTVYSSVDHYVMPDNVEILVMQGAAHTATGNGLDNVMYGTAGDDILVGGAGNDIMIGGAGNDIYQVTEAGDYVSELPGGGSDTVYSYVDGYQLGDNVETLVLMGNAHTGVGNAQDNALYGTAGDDILVGGAGNDAMVGGLGNDTYQVTEIGDDVIEQPNGGSDTVYSFVDGYQLANNVETLVMQGSDHTGMGNALDNTIYGTSGDDVIVGGGGNDTMVGGLGNDTYQVTEAGDQVIENPGEGSDTVYSFVDGYQLTANVETLVLQGNDHTGIGNDEVNAIYATVGANTLIGKGGADSLVGGPGADTFLYQALSDSTVAAPDTIFNFQSGTDKIDLTALHATKPGDTVSTQVQNGSTYVYLDNGGTHDFALVLYHVTAPLAPGDVLF